MPFEMTIECHNPYHGDRPSPAERSTPSRNTPSGPNGMQNGNHDHGGPTSHPAQPRQNPLFDKNGKPKDAIDPSYEIETAFILCVRYLKTMYDLGVLIIKNFEEEKLNNNFPDNPSVAGHIFRSEKGHYAVDNQEARNEILSVANDKANYLGSDKYGTNWYGKSFQDGTQIWVKVREGKITDAGKNLKAKEFNPETGMCAQQKPAQQPPRQMTAEDKAAKAQRLHIFSLLPSWSMFNNENANRKTSLYGNVQLPRHSIRSGS